MLNSRMASYLRSHRLKTGMSQRELADLVGIVSHQQVSQHERAAAIPSLTSALAYQIVFRVPMTELFPSLVESVKLNVEERLYRKQEKLQDSAAKGRRALKIARMLEWFWARDNPGVDVAA
jgi:transcriptional regulator with XRE-family HTH domain